MVKSNSHDGFARRVDSFRVRYAAVFIGSLFIAEAYTKAAQLSMIGGLGVVLSLTHVVVLGFCFLVTFTHKLATGCRRQLISVAIAPFMAFGILYLQIWSGLDPDYLNFLLMRPWYLAKIDRPGQGESAFYAWFWEETGGGITTRTYTVLVYDKTDQIACPPENRTPDCTSRVRLFASKSKLEIGATADSTRYRVQPPRMFIEKVSDHFYLVSP